MEGTSPCADYLSASTTLLTRSVMTSFAWGSIIATVDGWAAMFRFVSFSLRILTTLDETRPALPHDSTTSNSLMSSRSWDVATVGGFFWNRFANAALRAATLAGSVKIQRMRWS